VDGAFSASPRGIQLRFDRLQLAVFSGLRRADERETKMLSATLIEKPTNCFAPNEILFRFHFASERLATARKFPALRFCVPSSASASLALFWGSKKREISNQKSVFFGVIQTETRSAGKENFLC
jgi:hypothetical protein